MSWPRIVREPGSNEPSLYQRQRTPSWWTEPQSAFAAGQEPPDADTVAVLVHGGGGHSRWWDHIAPHLNRAGTVVAVDLSGHGDSDHCSRYSVLNWAREVRAVIDTVGPGQRTIVIGKSLGGLVALETAMTTGLAGVVTIDSVLRRADTPADERPIPVHARYDDLGAAMARFRTLPHDTPMVASLRDHIARHSVCNHGLGWTWKFDNAIFDGERINADDLRPIGFPAALLIAERGLADPLVSAEAARRLGDRAWTSILPDSSHHATLEHPVAVVAVLNSLLSAWS